MTTRRESIRLGCAALGAAALSQLPAFQKQRSQPNVLYIFGDQHRAAAMGCYGDPNVRTPNFDAFARQGAILKTAMSTTPVCCPHRASLMTGQYGHHNGMVTNDVHFHPKVACIAETFKTAGYVTGYSGKWNLSYPREAGQKRGLGFPLDNARDKKEDDTYPFTPVKSKDDHGRETTRLVFEPAITADQTIRFIEDQSKGDKPWMFFLSWIPPHAPYTGVPEYRKHYEKGVQLQPNVPPGLATEYARKALPGYYSMIESLDAEFARILRALDRAGVADDTIVCYSADHGDMIASHGYAYKRWPHDNSARVPFLIRYPRRIPSGKVYGQPFGTPDVYPTLAGLAGVKTPTGLDGADHSSLLAGQTTKAPRDYAFLQMMYGLVPWPGWRGFRTEEHMYARTVTGPWLLYEMRKDPFEMQNLVQGSSAKALVKEMDNRLAQIMKETGDSWEIKAATGDINDWNPGGKKQREHDLGGDWPGKAG